MVMITCRIILGLAFATVLLGGCRKPPSPAEIEAAIARDFPDVATISPAELDQQLRGSAPPLLLDVRTEQEFAVSHLPGAVRVDSGGDPAAQLPGVDREREIVVYCSVGYRSAAFGQALQRAGYAHVRNLQGSIFRWARENRPLVDAKGSTTLVHPYSENWGTLLPADRRSYLPK